MRRSPRDRRRPDGIDALILLTVSMVIFLGVMTWTSRPAELDPILRSWTPNPITTDLVGVRR